MRRFVNAFFDVADVRASNLPMVGQCKIYGLKYLLLNSRYSRQTSKNWRSSFIWFILHVLHSRSVRGVLSFRPVSMNKLCDKVLNHKSASLYLVSISSRYFSCLKLNCYILSDYK